VFRDELLNLLPHHQNATRLHHQTYTLAEFLTKKAPNYRVPLLHRKAVLHGHCHHKSLLKMGADHDLLRRMQVDFEPLDSGCCGMAGAFGFEKGEHYEVSIKCGERVLLPRVRAMSEGDILMTDGFSCHEQVLQETGKHALHLAQVLELALQSGEREPVETNPEPPDEQNQDLNDGQQNHHHNGHSRFGWLAPVGAAAVAAAATAAIVRSERGKR
jgi:Fe-S oxidoreductase